MNKAPEIIFVNPENNTFKSRRTTNKDVQYLRMDIVQNFVEVTEQYHKAVKRSRKETKH